MIQQTNNWQALGDVVARVAKETARKQFEMQAGLTEAANEKDSRMDSLTNRASEGLNQ